MRIGVALLAASVTGAATGGALIGRAFVVSRPQNVRVDERTGLSPAEPARRVVEYTNSEAGRRSLRGGSDEKPRAGGTITQCVTAQYGTLHNLLRSSAGEELVCRTYLFPPLLDLDPDTLELVPLLAESRPEISPDHRSYLWTLRRGVRWQRGLPDGTQVEVTTADVEYSWRMICDPKSGCEKARAALGPVDHVRILDPWRFVVETSAPYFKTEFEVGFNFRLMPAHLGTQDPAALSKDPLGRAPVGYGPYQFDEWKSGEYLQLKRNPDWFAADRLPYHFERVRIHFVPDVNQVPTLFERGDLALIALNDCARYEQMKQEPRVLELASFHEYYLTQVLYITWNELHPAFADARVRRAMTMLYPRELVKEKVYRGHAQVISGPWPAAAKESDPDVAPLPFDPAGAAKLLDEAGWQDHDGDGLRDKEGKPLSFTLSYALSTAPVFTVGTGWFQERLKAAGVAMEVRPVEFAQLRGECNDHRYEAAMLGWSGDPRDDDVYDRFHSDAIATGSNYAGYRSEECDRLLEQFRGEFDEAKRVEIAHQIHRRLAEDQPWSFLYNPQSLVLVSTKLRNVRCHTLGARWFDWWFAE